jgi:hypothetical protein
MWWRVFVAEDLNLQASNPINQYLKAARVTAPRGLAFAHGFRELEQC